jgi:gliding motility-associated-like protein
MLLPTIFTVYRFRLATLYWLTAWCLSLPAAWCQVERRLDAKGSESAYWLVPILGGDYYTGGDVGGRGWVSRISASGEVRWSRKLALDYTLTACAAPDGGVVVQGGSGWEVVVVRLSPSGDVLQTVELGSGWPGGIVWLANQSGPTVVWNGNGVVQVVRLDGQLLPIGSPRRLATPPIRLEARTAVPYSDGLLLAGTCEAPVEGQPLLADGWVLRLTANLETVWSQRLAGPAIDELNGLTILPDGRWVAVGTSGSFNPETPPTDLNFWIVAGTPAGDLDWSRTCGGVYQIPGQGIVNDYPEKAYATALLTDNTLAVAGYKDYYEGFRDVWLLRLDPTDGQPLTNQRFGGVGPDYAYALAARPDSGLILVGNTEYTNQDVYFIQLDSRLNLVPCIENPAPDQFTHRLTPIQNLTLAVNNTTVPALNPQSPEPQSLAFDWRNTLVTFSIEVAETPESCPGRADGQIVIQAQGGLRPYAYELFKEGSTGNGIRQSDSLFTGLSAGNYQVIVSDALFCERQYYVVFRPLEPLNLHLSGDTLWCPHLGNPVLTLKTTGGTPPYRVQHLAPDSLLAAGITGADSILYQTTRSGLFRFIVLDSTNCSDTVSLLIRRGGTLITELPADTFRMPGQLNEPGVFKLSTRGEPGGQWSGQALTDPTTGQFDIRLLSPGLYTYTYSLDNCQVEHQLVVLEPEAQPVASTTVLTPNGDGKNDELVVSVLNVQDYRLTVFDRFGNRVFQSVEPTLGWNGRLADGNPLSGVYFWTLEFRQPEKPVHTFTGIVTVVSP